MNQKFQFLLEKFIGGETLSVLELKELRAMFSSNVLREDISQWLTENWDNALFDDIQINYDSLKQKIKEYEDQKNLRKGFSQRLMGLSHYYQRIAAVLFVPLIIGGLLYLMYSSSFEENFYTAEASLGQKAKIELPDGSIVWLNSGSNIRYSSEFNKKNRTVTLNGEAFFEVKKNTGKPFFVHTPFLDVKVTGTRFNVNAYADDPFIETSLVEGKVDVILKEGKKLLLKPGNVLAYSKATEKVQTSVLNEEANTGWKDNRLIFINDDFSKLARKIEKWYDVKVIYDSSDFDGNKLTVKLLEGEQIGHLMEIIEAAVGAECTLKENKLRITKKK